MWKGRIYRYYFLIAAGIFLLGITGGAYLGYQKNFKEALLEELRSEEVSEILGGSKNLEKLIPNVPEKGAVSGQDIQVFPSSPQPRSSEPQKSPASSPSPKTLSPPSASGGGRGNEREKISACEAAQKDLEKQKLAAQKVYDLEIVKISRELSELQRQRNEAINNYLTAIAIATSKYNSATSTTAYDIYQQEQGAALNIYTQAITGISQKEVPALETKKTAQAKYNEALSAAQTQFESKISGGQNCTPSLSPP